jgi:hypothetical protein
VKKSSPSVWIQPNEYEPTTFDGTRPPIDFATVVMMFKHLGRPDRRGFGNGDPRSAQEKTNHHHCAQNAHTESGN